YFRPSESKTAVASLGTNTSVPFDVVMVPTANVSTGVRDGGNTAASDSSQSVTPPQINLSDITKGGTTASGNGTLFADGNPGAPAKPANVSTPPVQEPAQTQPAPE